MAIATTAVDRRFRRKSAITRMASRPPSQAFRTTSEMAPSMNRDWSKRVASARPSGTESSTASSRARMPSATWTVFASPSLKIRTSTPSAPPWRRITSWSLKPERTSATSRSRTSRPSVSFTITRADAVEGVQLVQGADQVAGLVLVDAAAGEVHVVGRERVPDLRDRDAVGGEAALVHVHLDLPDQPALDADRGDAVHRVEVLLEVLLGPLADGGERLVPGDADPEDRVRGWVEPEEPGPFGVFGELDAVEFFPGRPVRRSPCWCPRRNSRVTSEVPARDREVTRRSPGTTEAASSIGRVTRVSTSMGAAPGIRGLDGQRGIRDLREQVDRQPAERHEPEDAGGHG